MRGSLAGQRRGTGTAGAAPGIAAVVCGIVLGIQFMISSAEGQAQIKEKLFPYITGCVIIFGAFGIWKIIMILLGSV